MKAKIKCSNAKGVIKAPPSKSYAHRYLISGALSCGSIVSNISFSNDINATLSCLESLGFIFDKKEDKVIFNGYKKQNKVLNCLESGSTLRFFIPVALVLNEEATLIGSKKLFSRGLEIYEKLFLEQDIFYKLEDDSIFIKGRLSSGKYVLSADKSSQYISGLLFALPLLDGNSEIVLEGNIESASYIDLTIDTLKTFGVVINRDKNHLLIDGNQKYISQNVVVECDYSNAAFLEAFNLIGGEVEVKGLNQDSLQGDKSYLSYYPLLKETHPTIDISNSIDLGPILFTLSSMLNGATFKGINRLRIKESDRVKDLMDILEKFGVSYLLKDNEIEIYHNNLHKVNEIIDLPNDHRIVMAITVLLSRLSGEINGVEAINKSYPNFFSDIKKLGIEVDIYA